MQPEEKQTTKEANPPTAPTQHRSSGAKRLLYSLGALLALYLLTAYVLIPLAWKRDVRRHPDLFEAERVTHTPDGLLGDPINLALLGSESDLVHGMAAAKWDPADPITFRSSVRIAVDSVFRKPDDDAPVSTLELFGRKQDLAFEQPVGDSPRKRHHVRFWHWNRLHDGKEVWFGSVTFDERVGLSYTTGQVTHHIGPDLDAERDRLLSELKQAGAAQQVYYLDGFQQLHGKNGGGDPWHTDGRLGVAVLSTARSSTNVGAIQPAK